MITRGCGGGGGWGGEGGERERKMGSKDDVGWVKGKEGWGGEEEVAEGG